MQLRVSVKFLISLAMSVSLAGLFVVLPVSAETTIINTVSVSANSGQLNQASTGSSGIAVSVESTVNGQTESYQYAKSATSSLSHQVTVVQTNTGNFSENTEEQYRLLITQLRLLISLLQQNR